MVLVLMCFNSPSRLALYLRVKAHGAWCSRSRLKGARILFSFANIFSSRQMSFFPFSSPQHFIASRDLYRVQVWESVRVSHGGPVCTPALLMHLETRTVSIYVPWRTRLDNSSWRTLVFYFGFISWCHGR